jgi:hypothetical protein
MNLELTININAIPYVIQNNLHVEYFIWNILRKIDSSGIQSTEVLRKELFLKSTINNMNDSIFFSKKQNIIYLKGRKNFTKFWGKNYYSCNLNEIAKFARKKSYNSEKIHKKWNSTLIKYFLISIYASRYQKDKPFALELISKDLSTSTRTIQRALKVFGVERMIIIQDGYSPRSYRYGGKEINLSPNYYWMPIGKNIKLKF